MRVTDVLPAVKVWSPEPGRTLVDFGQNMVGWVRLTVRDTTAGQEVTVRHAEVLDHGQLCVRPLRSAKATDSYLLASAAEAVLEPSLTFHGFRYAEITGVTGLRAEDLEAVVVGTALRRTGWFSCSDPDLERFHENVVWGMRGNFLDVPTDCPQRDERLGWTGDIQVFAPTASFLFDTAGFLTSWLADLSADQYADGSVPYVIPDVLPPGAATAAGWGDAAVVVPWVLYQRYGDTQILQLQFASMQGWVDKVASMTTEGVKAGGFQFGDWLDPAAPPDNPFAAKADPDVVATAYLARSAEIVSEAARVLERDADAEDYASLAARTRDAFAREFVTGSGRVLSDAPTAYALALAMGTAAVRGAARARREPARRSRAGQRVPDRYRVPRHPADRRRARLIRPAGPRLPAAARAGLPVLAVSGHYGRHHHLGTLGQHAPGRVDQPGPDDLVQPLCSGRGRGLDAPHGRRPRACRPRLPGDHRAPRTRPGPDSRVGAALHPLRLGVCGVAAAGRAVHPGRGDASRDPSHRAPARREADGGAARPALLDGRRPRPGRRRSYPTVRDLIDSPRLWREAADVLIGHGLGEDAADVAQRLAPYLDLSPAALPLLVARKDPHGHGEQASRELEKLLQGH